MNKNQELTRQQKYARKQSEEGFEYSHTQWLFNNRQSLIEKLIELLLSKYPFTNHMNANTRKWLQENKHRLYFEIETGFVGKEKSDKDAKFEKGDISIRLAISNVRKIEGLDTVASDPIVSQWFYISLKEILSDVPYRIYGKVLRLENFNIEDHFLTDHNEFKEMENEPNKLIVFNDMKYKTGFHLYELHNLYEAQASRIVLEPEGGSQDPNKKKTKPAHPQMELKEGDVKRKVIIRKAQEHLRFKTYEDMYYLYILQFISDRIDLPDMLFRLDRFNKSYQFNDQEQEEIFIAAPSSYKDKKTGELKGKVPGAKRKEAIQCKMEYQQ